MKKVFKDKIINVEGTDLFDNKFLFSYLEIDDNLSEIETFYMEKLLKKKKNTELFNELNGRRAMWSEVYSPKDELKIFIDLFEYAITNKKKVHIVGITLKEELDILEDYYIKEGYLREDVNCFMPNFKEALVTVSVNIENLIWRGSDYKSNGEKIFFVPPIRESGQNKAMFKGLNRGSIASIQIKKFNKEAIIFLNDCITNEKILALTLAKVLKYNLEEIGFKGVTKSIKIIYKKFFMD